jgi:hypothetical protein
MLSFDDVANRKSEMNTIQNQNNAENDLLQEKTHDENDVVNQRACVIQSAWRGRKCHSETKSSFRTVWDDEIVPQLHKKDWTEEEIWRLMSHFLFFYHPSQDLDRLQHFSTFLLFDNPVFIPNDSCDSVRAESNLWFITPKMWRLIVANGNAKELHLVLLEEIALLGINKQSEDKQVEKFILLAQLLMTVTRRIDREVFTTGTANSLRPALLIIRRNLIDSLELEQTIELMDVYSSLFALKWNFNSNLEDYLNNCVAFMPLQLAPVTQREALTLLKQPIQGPLSHLTPATNPISDATLKLFRKHVESMPLVGVDLTAIALRLLTTSERIEEETRMLAIRGLMAGITKEHLQLGDKALFILAHSLFQPAPLDTHLDTLVNLTQYLTYVPDPILRSSAFYIVRTFVNVTCPVQDRLNLILVFLHESSVASIVAGLSLLKDNLHFYRHEKCVFSSPALLDMLEPVLFSVNSPMYKELVDSLVQHVLNLLLYMYISERKEDIWGVWNRPSLGTFLQQLSLQTRDSPLITNNIQQIQELKRSV